MIVNHARVVRFGIRSKLNCRQSGNHDPEYVKNDFYLAWNASVFFNAINGLIGVNKSVSVDTNLF